MLCFAGMFYAGSSVPAGDEVISPIKEVSSMAVLYQRLQLKQLGLDYNAFTLAVNGFEKLKAKGEIKRDIISICDFTQSSVNKRLYVIDLASGTLLFNTLVAHGKNTGEEFARFFSNTPSSNQSSLGFYRTAETYQGAHGLSLRLQGEEPGFNNNAEGRGIVVHGADYVSDNFASRCGCNRLGRSFGCPAVPMEQHEEIINAIKGGSCLFVYYPDKSYLNASRLIN